MRLFCLLIVTLFLSSCTDNVRGTEAHQPNIKINDASIEFTTQTLCWTLDDCMFIAGSGDRGMIATEPTSYQVEPNDTLEIEFINRPWPDRITLRIDEMPSFNDQWNYNGQAQIGLPEDPGTYTYNFRATWLDEDDRTQGLANYRIRLTIN